MIYHAFEIIRDEVEDNDYHIYVDSDKESLDEIFAFVTKDLDADYVAIGTVEADHIDEAIDKVRLGNWEYTDKSPI